MSYKNLHNKTFANAPFMVGTAADLARFKKRARVGMGLFVPEEAKLYVAETTAGVSDATVSIFELVVPPMDMIEFNGSTSYAINTDNITELTTASPFTLFAQVYVRDVSRDQTIMEIGSTSPTVAYRNFGIAYNGGTPKFFHGSTIGGTYVKTYLSNQTISAGNWYDVLIYGSSNGAYIYVDGIAGTGTSADAQYTNVRTHATGGKLYLGAHEGSSEFFDGYLTRPFLADVNFSSIDALDLVLKRGSVMTTNLLKGGDIVSQWVKPGNNPFGGDTISDLVNNYDLTETDIVPIPSTEQALPTNSEYTDGIASPTKSWHTDGDDAGANGKAFINLRSNYNFTSKIGSGDFSYLIRFKFDSLAANQGILFIGDNTASNDGYIKLDFSTTNGIVLYFRKTGSLNIDTFQLLAVGSTAIDTWYTVCFSRTGLTFDAWINGGGAIDENSTNLGTGGGAEISTDGGTDEFHLGRIRTTHDGFYFDGNIAQFCLWNTLTINASNQGDLYNSGQIVDVRQNIGSYTYTAADLVCQLIPQKDVTINTTDYITNFSLGEIFAKNEGENAGQKGSYENEIPS